MGWEGSQRAWRRAMVQEGAEGTGHSGKERFAGPREGSRSSRPSTDAGEGGAERRLA